MITLATQKTPAEEELQDIENLMKVISDFHGLEIKNFTEKQEENKFIGDGKIRKTKLLLVFPELDNKDKSIIEEKIKGDNKKMEYYEFQKVGKKTLLFFFYDKRTR